jgi:hypothetical protein
VQKRALAQGFQFNIAIGTKHHFGSIQTNGKVRQIDITIGTTAQNDIVALYQFALGRDPTIAAAGEEMNEY